MVQGHRLSLGRLSRSYSNGFGVLRSLASWLISTQIQKDTSYRFYSLRRASSTGRLLKPLVDPLVQLLRELWDSELRRTGVSRPPVTPSPSCCSLVYLRGSTCLPLQNPQDLNGFACTLLNSPLLHKTAVRLHVGGILLPRLVAVLFFAFRVAPFLLLPSMSLFGPPLQRPPFLLCLLPPIFWKRSRFF